MTDRGRTTSLVCLSCDKPLARHRVALRLTQGHLMRSSL